MDEKGVKSSEFWTKNLVQLIIIVGALTHHGVDEQKATIIVASLEGAYMALRTIKKIVREI